ncbi:hypothetical protein SLEP1_g6088 [Rubroshorea leprosula]|uniref:Uncharacterized protein n=1 Tax=Rubroshorea leprosula TaxID=152421 RepID=A0AAV5I4U6_9ROSI|nr:hypothetical protein SLEP1_g6088 [Rubroshorea leprosula]
MQAADVVASWRLNNARKIHAKINQSIDREKGELTGTGAKRTTEGATEEQRQQASPEKKPDLPPQRKTRNGEERNVVVEYNIVAYAAFSSSGRLFLPLKRGVQVTGILVPLIERCQLLGSEPLVLIVRVGLDAVVVDANFLVGVAHGDVEGEVVVEVVVGGEVELGKGGIRHVKLNYVGAEYEPEDEGSQTQDDDSSDYELDKEAQEAAAATARTMAVAVVGPGRWDGGAVVGPVQVGMFLCHGITQEQEDMLCF